MESPITSPFHTLETSNDNFPAIGVDPFSFSEVGLYPNLPTDLSIKPEMSPSAYSEHDEFMNLDSLERPYENAGLTMLQALTMQSPGDCGVGSPGSPDSGFDNMADFKLEDISDMRMENIAGYSIDIYSWMSCHPDHWSSKQVMAYVHWVADEMSFDNFSGENFQSITGPQLYSMNATEFSLLDPNYGQALFDLFSVIRNEEPSDAFDDLTRAPLMVPTTVTNMSGPLGSTSDDSDVGSLGSPGTPGAEEDVKPVIKTEAQVQPAAPQPKKRGRRPGQSSKSGPHLWEFIRNLLLDDQYRSIIRWEDRRTGIFRIIHSEAVAKMWGRQKNNQRMTYEKLSRALRFSRDAKYFDKLPPNSTYPKKLCFKFGPKSQGWQL